jgi:L-ascorbate metabolism protein UlaG (beta-lactamase superfamily)
MEHPQNNGYLFTDALDEGTLLHPGDSLPELPAGTDLRLMLLPVSAPWSKISMPADYLAQVRPATAVPIHDAILSAEGKALFDKVAQNLARKLEVTLDYRRLAPGEPYTP